MRPANQSSVLALDSTTGQENLPRSGALATKGLLFWIVMVAILLRLASALFQGNTVTILPGIHDQISYDGLARRVIEGHGFSFAEGHWPVTPAGEPTAHWSYLYTGYLAAVYSVFGAQPLAARLLQAVIVGVLQPWLTWRLGRRLLGPTAGAVAAAISAVYVYFFYYAGGLLTESFYLVGILWTFDVTFRILDRSHAAEQSGRAPWRLWLELGLALGVTGLLRQVFLLFAPFLFLWLWWNLPAKERASSTRNTLARLIRWSTVQGLLFAALVVVALIVPWTIRNYRAFGVAAPLNTNAGFAFFWGNHPVHGTHFVPLLGEQQYRDLIPQELLHLNEAELDRALLQRALGFIAADPLRFVQLSINRASEYFKFWPTAESGMVSNISRVLSFGLMLPFMLYGLWLAAGLLRQPQSATQRAELTLLLLFMVVYTGIHLASWTLIRYRLPVDAVLILFAGLGLVTIAEHFGLHVSTTAKTTTYRR
jgi:hypothetical protein